MPTPPLRYEWLILFMCEPNQTVRFCSASSPVRILVKFPTGEGGGNNTVRFSLSLFHKKNNNDDEGCRLELFRTVQNWYSLVVVYYYL